MYKYKTEMHCHTKEASLCGQVFAKDVVEAYITAGYNSLIITDHFGGRHISGKGYRYDTEVFLNGFSEAKKAAKDRINVILGMEICLSENVNDYLVYGIDEDFICKHRDMYHLSLPEFCDLAHENGLLVYQAHPFRNRMTIVKPDPLDGIEAFNAHPRHDSRNSIARAWAELYSKPTISGSDVHQSVDIARGGIMTKTEVKTQKDIVNILSSKDYKLITV